jgi:hypothetical protein
MAQSRVNSDLGEFAAKAEARGRSKSGVMEELAGRLAVADYLSGRIATVKDAAGVG